MEFECIPPKSRAQYRIATFGETIDRQLPNVNRRLSFAACFKECRAVRSFVTATGCGFLGALAGGNVQSTVGNAPLTTDD